MTIILLGGSYPHQPHLSQWGWEILLKQESAPPSLSHTQALFSRSSVPQRIRKKIYRHIRDLIPCRILVLYTALFSPTNTVSLRAGQRISFFNIFEIRVFLWGRLPPHQEHDRIAAPSIPSVGTLVQRRLSTMEMAQLCSDPHMLGTQVDHFCLHCILVQKGLVAIYKHTESRCKITHK